MKKTSFYLNVAVSALFAMGLSTSFQSCTVTDNPAEPEEPVVVDNRIKTAEDMLAAIQNGGAVELAAGAEIELTEPINVPGLVEIIGDEENPATIKLAAGFVVSQSFAIDNVVIDASELATPLISLPAEEAPATWVEIPVIGLNNVVINGLTQAVFYSGVKQYAIQDFVIDNSIIQVAADVTAFDYTKGSVALNQTIKNSTLYATLPTTKSLYSSQSGQKATEFNGDAIQKFSFQNSTVYNFAVTKNFFSHRQSNQTWLAYDIQNSIFLDCGKKGQVVKGVNGGQSGKNPTWTIAGNAFQFTVDGAVSDTSAEESTGDDDEPVTDSFVGTVSFANAAAGDFTQNAVKAGDPRWY